MAKKKSKKDESGTKSIGFAPLKRKFEKWHFFAGWAVRHTKKALGLYNPQAEGFMIGADVTTQTIAVKVLREDSDIVVAMDIGGAKHLVSELNKAISMVRYRG